MKSAKFFIVFTFLLAFAFSVSAQNEPPKIVWKNLQKEYENFQDIKFTIVNESNVTIYIFADVKLGVLHDYLELYRYISDTDYWSTVVHHGHPVNKKFLEKITSNLELKPQQESQVIFDEEDWLSLTESNGVLPAYSFRGNPYHKGLGKYKFKLQFYVGEKKSRKMLTTESPIFEITKEQKSLFDK